MKTKEYKGHTLYNRNGGFDDWFVKYNGRVRWGLLKEVKEDVDHILLFDKLPDRNLNGWA